MSHADFSFHIFSIHSKKKLSQEYSNYTTLNKKKNSGWRGAHIVPKHTHTCTSFILWICIRARVYRTSGRTYRARAHRRHYYHAARGRIPLSRYLTACVCVSDHLISCDMAHTHSQHTIIAHWLPSVQIKILNTIFFLLFSLFFSFFFWYFALLWARSLSLGYFFFWYSIWIFMNNALKWSEVRYFDFIYIYVHIYMIFLLLSLLSQFAHIYGTLIFIIHSFRYVSLPGLAVICGARVWCRMNGRMLSRCRVPHPTCDCIINTKIRIIMKMMTFFCWYTECLYCYRFLQMFRRLALVCGYHYTTVIHIHTHRHTWCMVRRTR